MQQKIKRLFDFFVASSLLWVIWPGLVLLAFLVRLKLGSPILFRQTRIGLHEKPFDMIKFRTMTDAADANGQPLPDEMRLTKFGQLLRSTSLDELPELWNILTGRMSLVGPRPLLPEYLPFYRGEEALRHTVRPGITGWWQIKSRAYEESLAEMQRRLRYDFYYIENLSVKLDIEIIFRTVYTVISGHGQA